MEIRFESHDVGAGSLNVAVAGDASAPLMICLHGFPEFWAGWAEVMRELAVDFRLVAPDQRGFNLSFRPAGVDAYRARHMVADLNALADRLSPDRPFILAGHDWGASVAYAYAMAHPERLSHLIVANGVHPVCFQRAILTDPEQRSASQYINRLRQPDAEALLSEDGFRRLARMVEGFSAAPFFDEAMKARYVEAWSRPGALTTMLNWYRASPIVVPAPDETFAGRSLLDMPNDTFMVPMRHLVIWGDRDQALLPSCLEGLDRFAPNLLIEHIEDASHWVLHEKPTHVAAAIRRFVGR
ncbi:alpha/beta hydrolase [Mesorhizobium sp. CAU 1741]|uniref:alpha/beta fold hydrolase n=1 Tax=Mesorhizobium sp. CAU 1741 TaxID=3140366 RepID=UPI00325A75F0